MPGLDRERCEPHSHAKGLEMLAKLVGDVFAVDRRIAKEYVPLARIT
jgi:hypothetical protein